MIPLAPPRSVTNLFKTHDICCLSELHMVLCRRGICCEVDLFLPYQPHVMVSNT